MTDRELAREALTKVPAVTLGFWIIKILATTLGETGGDTVTMTWLGETTPASGAYNGYLIGTAIFGVAAGRAGLRADPRAQLQPVALLGDHRRLDHLRAPPSPTSPTARSASAIRAARCCFSPACCVAVRLAPDARHGRRQHRHDAARRDLLLDHHHLLADAGNCARRLGRRCAGLGYSGGALVFGAGLALLAIALFHRPRSAASSCSGRRSSSPARSARRSATSSTSRIAKGGLELEPPARLGCACGRDHRPDPNPPAAAGTASRTDATAALTIASSALPVSQPIICDVPCRARVGYS